MANRIFGAWIVLLLATGQAEAQAQPSGAGEQVRERFERGQDLFESGKFVEAAAEFRAAYEIKPAAALIFNEAVCYEKMNDKTRAAALFQRYLDLSPQAKDRDAVKTRIAVLSGTSTAPAGTAPPAASMKGVFFIESNPPGATVYLDDKNQPPLGNTPWNGTIDGPHTVIVVAQGYKEEKKQVSAQPNTINQLYIALSQDQYLGWLEVRTNVPGADVFIDNTEGGAAGRAPYMGNLPPGKHSITVRRDGFTDEQKTIDIVAGEATKLNLQLKEAPIGFINVNVSGQGAEGASVKLDGKVICAAPCRLKAPTGDHTLAVTRSGQKGWSKKLKIESATETDVQVRLQPTKSRTDVIWKFVAGAALIGGGVYMTIKASDFEDEIARDMAMGMDTSDKETQQKVLKYGGWAALGLGGIAVVTGIVGLVAPRGPSSTGSSSTRDLARTAPAAPISSIRVMPAVGPGYAGFMATMRF